MPTAAEVLADAMTEDELQQVIVDAALTHGWQVFHDNDSRQNRAGFPDLVLCKPPKVIIIELKSAKGRIRPEQRVWLEALEKCDTISTGLVRPAELPGLLATLGRVTTETPTVR